MWREGERVNHIFCASLIEKLAQREYKQRHDQVAKVVRWKLYEKYHL